jgi:hypothetical protein
MGTIRTILGVVTLWLILDAVKAIYGLWPSLVIAAVLFAACVVLDRHLDATTPERGAGEGRE